MLLFMIYWIIIALWVYQNAKNQSYPPGLGYNNPFTNLLGVLLYVIYKTTNGVCAYCGAILQRGGVFCTYCGHKNGVTCEKCGGPYRLRAATAPNAEIKLNKIHQPFYLLIRVMSR